MRVVSLIVCIIVAALMVGLAIYIFGGGPPQSESVAVDIPASAVPPPDWSARGFRRPRQPSQPGPWSGMLNRLFTAPTYGLPDVIAALEDLNLQPDFELSIEQKQKIQTARQATAGGNEEQATIGKIKAVLTLEQNQKLQQYLALHPRVAQTSMIVRSSTRPATRPTGP